MGRLDKLDRPRVSLAVLARGVPEGFTVVNTVPRQGFNASKKQVEHFVEIRYDGPLGTMTAFHTWYAEHPDDMQLQLALRSMKKALECQWA